MGIDEVDKDKVGSDGTRMEGRAGVGQEQDGETRAWSRNDPTNPSQGVPVGAPIPRDDIHPSWGGQGQGSATKIPEQRPCSATKVTPVRNLEVIPDKNSTVELWLQQGWPSPFPTSTQTP